MIALFQDGSYILMIYLPEGTTMAFETRKDIPVEKSQEIQKTAPTRALSPFEEMDRLFEGVFPRGWRPLRWEWPAWSGMTAPFEGKIPRVDVINRDNDILVRAELPGVDKKDIEITTTENTVTIKGSARREAKEEKGDYYRCEIAQGAYARTVALPGDIDSTNARAIFKDGMLELILPKVEKSKRRSIVVD
jgi:HSP20 family protein